MEHNELNFLLKLDVGGKFNFLSVQCFRWEVFKSGQFFLELLVSLLLPSVFPDRRFGGAENEQPVVPVDDCLCRVLYPRGCFAQSEDGGDFQCTREKRGVRGDSAEVRRVAEHLVPAEEDGVGSGQVL